MALGRLGGTGPGGPSSAKDSAKRLALESSQKRVNVGTRKLRMAGKTKE